MIYDVKFIGLTPVENTGKIKVKDEDVDAALDAFHDYLKGIYGPNNYKIITFQQSNDDEADGFELSISPPTSKVLN